MMCNVLELFPNKKSFLLQGAKGSERKKELQKKVRTAFNNEIEGIEEYENAGGRGRRRIRDAFNKIGRTLATAGLAPARGAALALIRLNFRASASKLNLLEGQGREKLEAKWERLGGNKTKLRKAIDAGKGKKMLVCGKKCRAKAGKNPQLPSAEADDFVNAVETGVTAALIAAGGGVIAGLLKITDTSIGANKQKELLQLNAELNQADAEENAVDATMTPQERKIAEEIIKAQNSGFDPIQAIQNNPNLTADEKAAAIAEINESLGGDDNKKKILYFAVGAIVFVGLGYLIYKLSNKSE
jgi:rRNA processing protein Krr1/Pno1